MTEESEEEGHPIIDGPILELGGPEADIVRTEHGPRVRVRKEVAPGEWRERLFTLELWEEEAFAHEPQEGKDVMTFVGHIPRQAFEVGWENVSEIMLRRLEGLWDRIVREARAEGWWEYEHPGDIPEERLEKLREEGQDDD